MQLGRLWPFDIETYPNVMTMYVGNAESRECWGFEISERRDEREEMFSLLRHIVRNKGYLVGFNNVGFDGPVLHKLLRNQDMTVNEIYDFAMEVISADGDDKFKYVLPEKEILVPQIDLYKINHFDNKARSTSLKMIEFNLRSDNIEDLPFEPGRHLNYEEIDKLLVYNKHDMSETCKFLMENLGQIEFREKLSKQYKKNMLNFNDTKIGKDYFVMKLEEANPGSCYIQTPFGKKVRQTKRDEINLGECILPYIKFNRPEFQAVYNWLASQTITETKGVFTEILERDLGDVAKYANMTVKKKKLEGAPTEEDIIEYEKQYPLSWVEPVTLKSGTTNYYLMWRVADNLNVVVDGIQYDYGQGGLHGAIPNTIFESDNKRVIRSFDFASFYPHLSFKNNVYPEHFGKGFCSLYEEMFHERKKYAKGTPENAMMKLALNGTYGASNDKYSPFFDPKFTMTITISGQLTLTMLAEKLLQVPTLKIIMMNTDGLEFIVDREYDEQAEYVCSEFEELSGIPLEGDTYEKLCIADVNSYCGRFEDGSIKHKGRYQVDGFGWYQNQSSLVIPKAAVACLLEGKDVEDFIINHDDIYDFMLRTKVPRSSRLSSETLDEEGGIVSEQPLQNICRYYISNDGVALTKVMPPLPKNPRKTYKYVKDGSWRYGTSITETNRLERNGWVCVDYSEERRISIQAGQKVTVCNDINDYKGGINYSYYINEAKKLVDPLLDNN